MNHEKFVASIRDAISSRIKILNLNDSFLHRIICMTAKFLKVKNEYEVDLNRII